MKKAFVFLDLDDTILDFHQAERTALSRTLRELGAPTEDVVLARYSEINARQWEKLEEGLLTREQVLVSRFDLLFGELGLNLPGRDACRRYENYLKQGHWFMPGAEELLRRLRGTYGLYLASNGAAEVQASRLKSAGIVPLFDGIFISEELGADKPSPDFFHACFARIPDFDLSRAIMVGDSLTSDIRGGINAGMRTCWYNFRKKKARPEIRADWEIEKLEELPELLERIFP